MPLLRIANLTKSYEVPGQDPIQALAGVDLDVDQGEFVIFVGHNGSGKSTLFSIIANEEEYESGVVNLAVETADGRASTISLLRQHPEENVVPDLTVEENFRLCDTPRWPSIFRTTRSGRNPLPESLNAWSPRNQLARNLSGGQKQLLALELTLLHKPPLLLLDEPTASLDQENARLVLAQLVRVWRGGYTILMVTHDLAAALSIGTRLIVMVGGRILADFKGAEKEALSLPALYSLCGFGFSPSP